MKRSRSKLIRSVLALVAITSAHSTSAAPDDPFGRYPTTVHAEAHHAWPRLRTSWARHFADYLERTAQQPVDFAGHYVLATEGCGAGCLMVAAVDVRSGRVVELKPTVCCWPDDIDEPLSYRPYSRLLIAHGQLQEAGDAGPHRFLLQAGRFVRLPDR